MQMWHCLSRKAGACRKEIVGNRTAKRVQPLCDHCRHRLHCPPAGIIAETGLYSTLTSFPRATVDRSLVLAADSFGSTDSLRGC